MIEHHLVPPFQLIYLLTIYYSEVWQYTCGLCGKYDKKHWREHWLSQHKQEPGLELLRGHEPPKPWCSNWYDVLASGAAPVDKRIIRGFQPKNEGGRMKSIYKIAQTKAMTEFAPD